MIALTDAEMETPQQRWHQLWPFMSAFGLGFALAWAGHLMVPRNSAWLRRRPGLIIVVVGISVVFVVDLGARLDDPDPGRSLCIAVDLMRASGGGSAAGYGSLLLIPVIWQAMRRDQVTLILTIVFVSVANIFAVMVLASRCRPRRSGGR